MTIQIPDDLARSVEGEAAALHKSVEQIVVDSLRARFERKDSPGALLRAIRESPHVSAEGIAELDASILDGRLAPIEKGWLDE